MILLRAQNKNTLSNALVRELALQMTHQPIVITANGFFNINFEVLVSVGQYLHYILVEVLDSIRFLCATFLNGKHT